jgi:hypothetical protein
MVTIINKKLFFVSIFLTFVLFLSGCTDIIPSYDSSPEIKRFVGDWEAISPTRLSKVGIHSFGSNLYIHVWHSGNPDHPEDYDFGMQNYQITDFFGGLVKLHWDYFSNSSEDHTMEILSNGVLKIEIIKTYHDQNIVYSYTDYFYNLQVEDSFAPPIYGMGLYQEDTGFVNLVYQLDSPRKICQYMDRYFNYKVLDGPHSPYQTYLSREGDCGDHAVLASNIAHFHGYDCNYISMKWTNGHSHAIIVYNMGDHYTYSSVQQYFNQSFDSILDCVNHCTSDFGYVLSDYEIFNCDYYNYRNLIR